MICNVYLFSQDFEISYDDLPSPISLSSNSRNYSADGFAPYTILNVTVNFINLTDDASFARDTVLCVTEEACKFQIKRAKHLYHIQL